MLMNLKELSVVIPCFNEEARIGKTVHTIESYLIEKGLDYEIIMVDDGSSDETIVIAERHAMNKKRFRAIQLEHNQGKGNAVKTGALKASKEWIVFSDADLSTPIETLDDFDNYSIFDIIIGSRNLADSQIKIKQPFFRSTLGKLFPFLVKLLVVRGIQDTQCGFKLMRRNVAQKIFPKQRIKGFAFDVEFIFLAQKYGFSIKELAVEWSNAGGSKVNPIADSFRMLLSLVRIRMNDVLGKYD